MIADHDTFRVPPSFISEVIGDECVILDLEKNAFLETNPVGGAIWQRLTSGASVAEIVSHVCEAFEVEHDDAREDVVVFLGDLLTRGLIERSVP